MPWHSLPVVFRRDASSHRLTGSPFVLSLVLILLMGIAGPANAQSISNTVPAAVRPGETVDVTVNGAGLETAAALWAGFPHTAEFVAPEGEKPAKSPVVKIAVPATVPVGVYGIRLGTATGSTPLHLMMVDDLPSVVQAGNSNNRETPQALNWPVAVDGFVGSLERRFFQFTVAAGQTLSVEVVARRLGSPLDPSLRILDASGREIAYSDDEPGLQADARCRVEFPEAGTYVVELRDVRYQGSGNHRFRLRVGDFPLLDPPFPSAVVEGRTLYAEPLQTVIAENPAKPVPGESGWRNVSAGTGTGSGFAFVAGGAAPEFAETEPNDTSESANVVTVDTQLNGQFDQSGDIDMFRFEATKGRGIRFRGVSRQVGSPADLTLTIFDAANKQLAHVDDTGTEEGILDFNPPADGVYVLKVADLLDRGAQTAYRVETERLAPAFELTVAANTVNVPAGGHAALEVTAARRGYDGPIELSAVGLPDGIVSLPTVLGPGQTLGVLTFRAAADVSELPFASIRILGQATTGSEPPQAVASTLVALRAQYATLPYPPPTLLNEIGIGRAPAPSFVLTTPDVVTLGPALSTTFTVTATRQAEWDGAIELAIVPAKNGLPAGVTIDLKPVPEKTDTVEVTVTATDKARLGEFTAVINGTLKKDKATVVQPTPGIRLTLTPPLQVTQSGTEVPLAPGGEVQWKIKLDRNPALPGPLKLKVAGLPAGVTAEEITAAPDAAETVIAVKAAADAAIAKTDGISVQVLAVEMKDAQLAETPKFALELKAAP